MDLAERKAPLVMSDIIAPIYNKFFFDWETREYYINGGRIGAKGDAVYSKAALKLAQQRGEVRVFIPEQSMIKDGPMKQVGKVCNRLGIKYVNKPSTNRMKIGTLGSEIIFKGLAINDSQKKPESFKTGDTDSIIFMLIFDEVAGVPDRDRIDTIIETYGRQPSTQMCFIWNPPLNRAHWTFDLVEEAKIIRDEGGAVDILSTTIWDLPAKWTGLNDARDKARRMARFNPTEYKHKYLGLSTGQDDTAYPVTEDELYVKVEDFDIREYTHFYCYADNGSMDATVFGMYGVNYEAGTCILINLYYHSGRDTGKRKTFSQYANEMKVFLYDREVPRYIKDRYDGFYCDSIIFSDECDLIGLEVPYLKGKRRGIMYEVSNEIVMEGRFKVLNLPQNRMFVMQMLNAQLDTVMEDGRERKCIAKVDNRRVKEERQIHALDTFTYLMMKIGNKLRK